MTALRPSWTERALHRLVRLLPADFRSDFRSAIEADLAERSRAGDRAGLLRREFPSLLAAIVREHVSALWRGVRQDVNYAFRMMRRTPGFTALAVLMLALGTGVNAALFSVVDAVMLRTAFVHPDELVIVRTVENNKPTSAIRPDQFEALTTAPGPFQVIAGLGGGGNNILTGLGDPRSIDVECVSASMFDVLGTRPLFGRTFSAIEDRAGAEPTMVVSFDFWRQLGGLPSIVGRSITLNQTPVAIVGVMPPGFAGPFSRSDTVAWLPINRPIAGGGAVACPTPSFVNVFARVREGMTLEAAQRGLAGFTLTSLEEQTFDGVRQPLLVLAAAVAFVLLIACFNVGGLQMERTLARRREMALRLALGAGRGRLVRQTLTENVVLALAGAAAGLAATWLTLRALISLLPSNLPHLDQIAVNGRVLVATVAVASAAGIVAGLLPIGQLRRVSPGRDLTDGSRTSERRGNWTRRSLVVAEVALSVVVLIGAALMIQTFVTLRLKPLGFDPERKMSLLVRLPGATAEASARFFSDLFDRLRAAPGIRGLAGSTYLPMRGTVSVLSVTFADTTVDVDASYVTPGYVELMKIPMRAGRTFTADDARGAEPVAIVNEVLARRIRPDGQVVGQLIGAPLAMRRNDSPIARRIVGVATNTRSSGAHTRSRSEVYFPYAQDPRPVLFVIAESEARNGSAVGAELRGAVRALRPDLVVEDVDPIPAMLDRSVRYWWFGAWLLGVFAALAVALAAVGLMTTIGWWVNQRRRELGVRMALGASRGEVMRLVFRQGLLLGTTGIVAGCVIAAGVTRYLEGWIYGVTALDVRTFAGCSVGMLCVAAIAVYFPVRRATSVDPVTALRAE
jgi:putative ABC transport system permease protein